MSLNWQFTNKEAFAKFTDKDKEENNIFVWACMAVGLRAITEKNAEEWHWRFSFATKLNGPLASGKDGIVYIPSLEEVKKRIGLTTNCSERTRNQFVAGQVRMFKV